MHVEVKPCADGPHIIELNGRLGGFIPELFEPAAGVDLVALAAAAAIGRQSASATLDERGPVATAGVRFQHSSLLPHDAAQFLEAPTGGDLARRADVDFYRLLASPGVEFAPGVATHESDLVQARADDLDAMLSLIAELRRETVLRFRGRDGSILTLTGEQIAMRNQRSEDAGDPDSVTTRG